MNVPCCGDVMVEPVWSHIVPLLVLACTTSCKTAFMLVLQQLCTITPLHSIDMSTAPQCTPEQAPQCTSVYSPRYTPLHLNPPKALVIDCSQMNHSFAALKWQVLVAFSLDPSSFKQTSGMHVHAGMQAATASRTCGNLPHGHAMGLLPDP